MDFTTTNSAFWQNCNPDLWCSTICQAKLSTRVHMKFLRLTESSAVWNPISLQSDQEFLRQACLLSSQEKEKLHIELHMACYGRRFIDKRWGKFLIELLKGQAQQSCAEVGEIITHGKAVTKKIKQLKVVCSCVAMNEITILSSSLSLSFVLVQIGIMLCSYRKQRKSLPFFPSRCMPFPLLHIFIITRSVQNMLCRKKTTQSNETWIHHDFQLGNYINFLSGFHHCLQCMNTSNGRAFNKHT